ncbi:MAG: DUF2795 domain-containing protein [Nitrososphaerota archaeon]
MTSLKDHLEHLKNHVKYPATRSELIAACNNMSDLPSEDRNWIVRAIPEGRYNSPVEVLKALIDRV